MHYKAGVNDPSNEAIEIKCSLGGNGLAAKDVIPLVAFVCLSVCKQNNPVNSYDKIYSWVAELLGQDTKTRCSL